MCGCQSVKMTEYGHVKGPMHRPDFSQLTWALLLRKARDFNLLSFGGEATEDEEESVILNKKFTGKGKSAHDHLTDPKLSSQPAAAPSRLANK
ncbi:hypothetical protein WN48_08393 [Eufriesea mexicana]|nr:hypothetical protein WN48_08393 [Eufriesea mexicana]